MAAAHASLLTNTNNVKQRSERDNRQNPVTRLRFGYGQPRTIAMSGRCFKPLRHSAPAAPRPQTTEPASPPARHRLDIGKPPGGVPAKKPPARILLRLEKAEAAQPGQPAPRGAA